MVKTLRESQQVKVASALFAAQNSLGMYWQSINTGKPEDIEQQKQIEIVQDKIRLAVAQLGDVLYLCEIGA